MGGEQGQDCDREAVEMPAPTAWPLAAAFGATLAFAGLVTSAAVSAVGVVLFVAGAVGWFREVLPREHVEAVPLRPPAERARPVVPVPQRVEHLTAGGAERHRMRIPLEIHPYSAGVRGGLTGAAVMAILALMFGLMARKSPWYPINLLAAAAMPSLATATVTQLSAFNAAGLAVASVVHLLTSVVVGLLYGMILPMIPRHPMLVGGLVAPLLWTGLIWASLGIVNPALNARIEWHWFIASQIGFGLAVGNVVSRTEKIATLQSLPFVARAGLEAQAPEEEGRR